MRFFKTGLSNGRRSLSAVPTGSTADLVHGMEIDANSDSVPLTPTRLKDSIRQGTDNITFVLIDNYHPSMSELKTPPEPATPPATPADPVDVPYRPDAVKAAAAQMERSISQTSASDNKPIDIAVYFPDGNGIAINLLDGKNATVDELIDLVIEEKKLPAHAKQVFDLWFISPHLALQLKANHVPFRLALKWEELLTKYTRTKDSDIDIDEPVLTFMRNVYFTREEEQQLNSEAMLELLFAEAKAKVLHGMYPCDPPQFIELGGLLALLEYGAFNGIHHTQHFYDQHMSEMLPSHQKKRRLSLKGKNPREQLLESHRMATNKFENSLPITIKKEFLKICWELPFYGCAFFDGQIATPRTGVVNKIIEPEDTYVRIGINRDGLFVIDPFKVSLILGLTYKEFSWDYAKSDKCDEDPKNCLPCLFIQFQVEGVNKLLQIFSKQAVMMDALIDAFVGYLTQSQASDQVDGGDCVDGTIQGCLERQDSYSAKIKSAKGSSCLSNKLNRLSLTTVVIPE